jgi:hypothetical protein
MNIEIKRCFTWINILLEAVRLKREIRKQMNLTPKMSSAGKGVLDVVVDGKTVFSHLAGQRMPGRGEVVRLIQASMQP